MEAVIMIYCNLNVLLAQRNLKIKDVQKATGISRTILTSLAYGHAKGIQFDTLSTLCEYLQVSPSELLLDRPVIDFYRNDHQTPVKNNMPCMVFLPGDFNMKFPNRKKPEIYGKMRKEIFQSGI